MISLQDGPLRLVLHEPEDGFYRGTRFDRSGVFDSIDWHGTELAGRWFPRYDPFLHDAVCGPAEEFSPVGFDSALPGGTFLKPGVGLLVRPDEKPYDRFRLYEVADPGEWTAVVEGSTAIFRHRMGGIYDYRKEVGLLPGGRFFIRHALDASVPVTGNCYNHNFFTLGKMETGPGRALVFPFVPEGNWRAEYDKVGLTPAGIRFRDPLEEGESVYMGDLHARGGEQTPYRMTLSEADGNFCVRIRGDRPLTHAVFWANHRIACIEPYVQVEARPGKGWDLRIDYQINKSL